MHRGCETTHGVFFLVPPVDLLTQELLPEGVICLHDLIILGDLQFGLTRHLSHHLGVFLALEYQSQLLLVIVLILLELCVLSSH